jgi:ketosteroid isomerase-like protein
MKSYLSLFLLCSFTNALGQGEHTEINDQVWKPFIQTFNNYDTKGFMALHSKEVARAPRDAKTIWNWDEYYKKQEQGDLLGKSAASKRSLELRFTERIVNKDLAINVGVYKTSSIRPDGTTEGFYGRFHVVLRKENGIWKILVDTDSSEGRTISEQDFLAASPIQ